MSDSQVQLALQEKWKAGHDAVLIENYRTQSGEWPKLVVAVKDPAQLRSPDAHFDPAKRHLANIYYSLPGGGLIAAGALGQGGVAAEDRE